MKVYFGSQKLSYPQGAAVTIGNFDGVHLGHRYVLTRLREAANQRHLPAIAIVFEPQPAEFFAVKSQNPLPYRITPLREKLTLLEQTQCLDAVWVLRFNQTFASLTAENFIQDILIQQLNTQYLLIGDDFRFGEHRRGNLELLKQYNCFHTEQLDSFLIEQERASSTTIRQLLHRGNLERCKKLLGHDYFLSGHVKHGAKIGRTLQCPTANIHLPNLSYPMSGIFVVEVLGLFGKRYGVASFGVNPTVSNTPQQKLEIHLFDYHGNLYGQRLQVSFLHKLRDEKQFTSLDALKLQIKEDIDLAHAWLENKLFFR